MVSEMTSPEESPRVSQISIVFYL